MATPHRDTIALERDLPGDFALIQSVLDGALQTLFPRNTGRVALHCRISDRLGAHFKSTDALDLSSGITVVDLHAVLNQRAFNSAWLCSSAARHGFAIIDTIRPIGHRVRAAKLSFAKLLLALVEMNGLGDTLAQETTKRHLLSACLIRRNPREVMSLSDVAVIGVAVCQQISVPLHLVDDLASIHLTNLLFVLQADLLEPRFLLLLTNVTWVRPAGINVCGRAVSGNHMRHVVTNGQINARLSAASIGDSVSPAIVDSLLVRIKV